MSGRELRRLPDSRLLLDTHALIWMLEGSRRLGRAAIAAVRAAAAEDGLLVSAITPWEIAMLVEKGRLRLAMEVQAWVNEALRQPGVQLVPLLPEIAVLSTRLPWAMHADPADRILAATALHLDVRLLTADARLLEYGAAGHLRCLRAQSAGRAG